MDLIHNPVLIIYSPRPIPRKSVFEWFGFTNAFKRVSLDMSNKSINSIKYLFTSFLPV